MDYTTTHKMKVNNDKSKVMIFNNASKFDFKPELYLDSVEYLNIVESTQLLEVKIRRNLKWNANTEFICTKAYARLWMIRRLKSQGATANELVDVFEKQVRCIL